MVNFDKDTGMSEVHEEDLEFKQKESEAVMNLGLDEVCIGYGEEECVSVELEKNTSEINVK
jgi:hypothetical protein